MKSKTPARMTHSYDLKKHKSRLELLFNSSENRPQPSAICPKCVRLYMLLRNQLKGTNYFVGA